ncbi:hypothetical protein ABZZ74_54250, partial [Streptomyces sp. NPDC006476]
MSRAVQELRADGFVIDSGVDEVTGRGRRSTYLDMPGTTGHVAGVIESPQNAAQGLLARHPVAAKEWVVGQAEGG